MPPQEAHSQPQTESFYDTHHQYPQMVPNIKTEMPWSQHDYPGCRDMNGSWSPTDLRINMSRTGYHPLHNIGELGQGPEGKPMIQAAALAGYSGMYLGKKSNEFVFLVEHRVLLYNAI